MDALPEFFVKAISIGEVILTTPPRGGFVPFGCVTWLRHVAAQSKHDGRNPSIISFRVTPGRGRLLITAFGCLDRSDLKNNPACQQIHAWAP